MNVKISSPTQQNLSQTDFDNLVVLGKVMDIDGSETVCDCGTIEGAYADDMAKFKEMFPNVSLEAQDDWIRFFDNDFYIAVINNFYKDGKKPTLENLSRVNSYDFINNTNVRNLLDFKYLTSINGNVNFRGFTNNFTYISLPLHITNLSRYCFLGVTVSSLYFPSLTHITMSGGPSVVVVVKSLLQYLKCTTDSSFGNDWTMGFHLCYSCRGFYTADTYEDYEDYAINGNQNAINLVTIVDIPSVDISNEVESLSKFLFLNNNKITKLVLSKTITVIGDYVFYNCTSLNDISYNGTVNELRAITYGTTPFLNCPATKIVCADGEVALSEGSIVAE